MNKNKAFKVEAIVNSKPSRSVPKGNFSRMNILKQYDDYKKAIIERQPENKNQLLENLMGIKNISNQIEDKNKTFVEIQKKRKMVENEIKSGAKTVENFSILKQLKKNSIAVSKPIEEMEATIFEYCNSLPNLVDPSNPSRKPKIVSWINPKHKVDPSVVEEYQGDRDYSDVYVKDEKLDHYTILTRQKSLMDFYTASNTSGSNCYYLFDELVMLENALITYALTFAKSKGFSITSTPSFAKTPLIAACGYRPTQRDMESQIYTLENTQQALIATSEITLAGYEMTKVFSKSELPIKKCAISRAFRKEADAQGTAVKGLYRVHEFNKVELFVWTTPDKSNETLEELKDLQVELIKSLGLTAQVLQMPNNDLGAPAYKKYDIECWMPGKGAFGEITSTSNCTDFQSRRLLTRYRDFDDENRMLFKYVHTLNGTCMAVPRVILAIVENYYNPETNRITVPEVLVPLMGMKEF
ncbi:related to Serine--tRNA ligase, mitochondrial [Hanseniaspora guilliermondii]|uniref:serine--tRNA ligase n=1 Tax=Hanseniaspora guilliermondii TaxID=56406 RepID=A0A1L0CHE8_9ASCO|nr:related to Serine--tRNA ligase, mitochondrial [Hanseniaspora guilliermondii]